ncbi:MAG: tetratricopeptide repeat protein [Pseudomonadota bacterium]
MARFLHPSAIALLLISLSACGIDGRSAEERAYAAFEERHYLDARVHLANAIGEDPDDPALHRLLGESALALGDGQIAETSFRRAIAEDAALTTDVAPYLAHAHLLQGEIEDALAILGDPRDDHAYALRLLAQARLQNGETAEAWQAIERAIAAAPEDAAILALAGQYQLSTGNIGEAEDFARRSITDPSASVEAHLLMGRIHSIRGDLEAALDQYRTGTEHFRDHVGLYIAQAAIHADRQEVEEMETAIARVERIVPGHPGAVYIAARHALNSGEIERAHELTQGMEQAARNNPPLLLLLGEVQMHRGNAQQGITHLLEFLRFYPHHAKASFLLAHAQNDSGNIRQAFATISAAASRADTSHQVVAYAAHLAERIGDPQASRFARRASARPLDEAQDRLTRAQQAMRANEWQTAAGIYDSLIAGDFANHALILNNAAMAHLRAGNAGRAMALADRAYALTPDDPSVLDSVGWIRLAAAEDRAGSLALLRRAYRLAPGNPQIRLHLAQALAANGFNAQARTHIEGLMGIVDGEQREILGEVLAQL